MPRPDDKLPENVEMLDKDKLREARKERIRHMICDYFGIDRANWRTHKKLVDDLIVAFDSGGQPEPPPPPPPSGGGSGAGGG